MAKDKCAAHCVQGPHACLWSKVFMPSRCIHVGLKEGGEDLHIEDLGLEKAFMSKGAVDSPEHK